MTVLAVRDVSVVAGELCLLSGISFEVSGGQGLIIRGPNGIGKSSLLLTLCGLAEPYSGSIDLKSETEADHLDLPTNCHYLGHQNGLKPHQTVKQNLEFFCAFFGGVYIELETVVSRLSLERLLDLPVRFLSAGQKRRVAFGRLMLAKRKVWILDEPTSAIDATTTKQITKLCAQHIETGGILVAATHLPFLNDLSAVRTVDLSDYVPAQQWVESF